MIRSSVAAFYALRGQREELRVRQQHMFMALTGELSSASPCGLLDLGIRYSLREKPTMEIR